MMRIIAVVTAARNAIRMSRSYGNPIIVYSLPSNAVSPSRSPYERGTLAVRMSLDEPLVAATRVCCPCSNPTHILNDCPALYFTDTNTDHSCSWTDSIVGRAWLTNGEAMWQEMLILPGYTHVLISEVF